uniref:Laminin G domain-containing protein n=1 Tax=Glossina pallidipes TaxID=7398 RepID=A0A1A9ZZG6_GLOPL
MIFVYKTFLLIGLVLSDCKVGTLGALEVNIQNGFKVISGKTQKCLFQKKTSNGFKSAGPCHDDLAFYDITSAYSFEGPDYQHIQNVTDSKGGQFAFHTPESSNMSIELSRAFPKGISGGFSLACVFRLSQPQLSGDFYLFKSTGRNEYRMSISVCSLSNNIEFSLSKYDGNVETVKFEGISIPDSLRHNVKLVFSSIDGVSLWVGPIGEPGYPAFTRMPGEKGKMGGPGPVEPPGVGCHGAKGEEGPCGFLEPPGVLGLKEEPGLSGVMWTHGYPGVPGSPGFMGIRGERGLPRLMGPSGASGRPASANAATEYHNFSEDNVREICISVVKNYINEISNTTMGLPGRPGLSGNPGQKLGRIFNLNRHQFRFHSSVGVARQNEMI